MKKIAYIAGKITGDPNYIEKFARAAAELVAAGYIVLNPATLPAGMTRAQYMRICFAMIDCSDIVFLLDDWTESDGAHCEVSYCGCIDKPTCGIYAARAARVDLEAVIATGVIRLIGAHGAGDLCSGEMECYGGGGGTFK